PGPMLMCPATHRSFIDPSAKALKRQPDRNGSTLRRITRLRPRRGSVVRKLKVPPSGPIPFGERQIVLINSIQQSTSGNQECIFSDTVFKRRGKTGGDIFTNRSGAFLRGDRGCRERALPGIDGRELVGDP